MARWVQSHRAVFYQTIHHSHSNIFLYCHTCYLCYRKILLREAYHYIEGLYHIFISWIWECKHYVSTNSVRSFLLCTVICTQVNWFSLKPINLIFLIFIDFIRGSWKTPDPWQLLVQFKSVWFSDFSHSYDSEQQRGAGSETHSHACSWPDSLTQVMVHQRGKNCSCLLRCPEKLVRNGMPASGNPVVILFKNITQEEFKEFNIFVIVTFRISTSLYEVAFLEYLFNLLFSFRFSFDYIFLLPFFGAKCHLRLISG